MSRYLRYFVFSMPKPFNFAVCKAPTVEDGFEQLNMFLNQGMAVRFLFVTDDPEEAFSGKNKSSRKKRITKAATSIPGDNELIG